MPRSMIYTSVFIRKIARSGFFHCFFFGVRECETWTFPPKRREIKMFWQRIPKFSFSPGTERSKRRFYNFFCAAFCTQLYKTLMWTLILLPVSLHITASSSSCFFLSDECRMYQKYAPIIFLAKVKNSWGKVGRSLNGGALVLVVSMTCRFYDHHLRWDTMTPINDYQK